MKTFCLILTAAFLIGIVSYNRSVSVFMENQTEENINIGKLNTVEISASEPTIRYSMLIKSGTEYRYTALAIYSGLNPAKEGGDSRGLEVSLLAFSTWQLQDYNEGRHQWTVIKKD